MLGIQAKLQEKYKKQQQQNKSFGITKIIDPDYNTQSPVMDIAILTLEAWEFCNKPEIGEKACKAGKTHFMCADIVAPPGYYVSVAVVAPPMTRKIKRHFLEFFNNLRNNVSSGTYTNKVGQTFPIAARMREVIWDNELEFMMQTWVRSGKESKLDCVGSQRLNFVYAKQRFLPKTLIKYQIQEKCKVTGVPGAPGFLTTIQERMSRIGCSAAVGLNASSSPKGTVVPHLYLIACALDFEVKGSQAVYKVHPTDPASECDHWGATKSTKYPYLCTNTGEIFPYVEENFARIPDEHVVFLSLKLKLQNYQRKCDVEDI
uniref:SCP domain-containing protein n=1 Tax=Glossina pallidipes TaxID=7398 RepID=A0A1B0AB60_GLOPL